MIGGNVYKKSADTSLVCRYFTAKTMKPFHFLILVGLTAALTAIQFPRLWRTTADDGGVPIAGVTYEYVRQLVESASPNACIIDVRNRSELTYTGEIPTALNIPLNDLEEVLSQPLPVLKRRFRISSKDDEIVFSCRTCRRSALAVRLAQTLGFRNCKLYVGGHREWKEREGGGRMRGF